jgi:hypothetical protein
MRRQVAIPPALIETLSLISPDLDALQEDWWLIGSAALVLSGVALPDVQDIDILTTPAGAAFLAERWGPSAARSGPTEHFRSDVFFKRTDTPLPIDVMAGFEVNTPDGWTPVRPKTRVALAWLGGLYFAPSHLELLDMLALFGRPKDRERAALLSAVPWAAL